MSLTKLFRRLLLPGVCGACHTQWVLRVIKHGNKVACKYTCKCKFGGQTTFDTYAGWRRFFKQYYARR